MFSVVEKAYIAQMVEDAIRKLGHPEMDNKNIRFNLHIDGKEPWSWADIHENSRELKESPNLWNEVSRLILDKKGE